MIEDQGRVRVRHGAHALAHPQPQLLALGLDRGEELLLGQALLLQERPEPGDRVLGLPGLGLLGGAVAGGVVGGGVRAHPVGERLDQHRTVAAAGVVERPAGDRQAGQHVVAVDPDAGEAEAGGAAVQRDLGLGGGGLGDRPLVVLAEEDHRGVVDRGEGEGLVDVALAGGAVAEVGDHRVVRAVLGDAHRVAGGVQGLRADHDGVQVEVLLVRVPAAVVHAAEHAEQVQRVHVAAPGHAVLAVGGEGVVTGAHGPPGADLGGLLAEQRGPQAQLALTLQRGGLGVEPAHQHQVAVEGAQLVRGGGERVVRVLDPLAFRGEQLYELRLGVRTRGAEGVRDAGGRLLAGPRRAFDGHVHSSVCPAARGRR